MRWVSGGRGVGEEGSDVHSWEAEMSVRLREKDVNFIAYLVI